MNIVAVQLDIAWEDKAANHRRVCELLDAAGVAPGSLVVLPEMFETGFSMKTNLTAQDDARAAERFLRELASRHECAVLAGVVGPVVGGKATNEAVVIAPDGAELARYAKMQLFTPAGEHIKYRAGERHTLFEWQGVKAATFICYDLRFPELFRAAASDGAELLVVIADWPEARSEHWVRLLQARAIENQAYAVGVNRCGVDPHVSYDGRTVAFGPLGERLMEADAREQVLTCSVNPDAVRRWRAEFPALRDKRF